MRGAPTSNVNVCGVPLPPFLVAGDHKYIRSINIYFQVSEFWPFFANFLPKYTGVAVSCLQHKIFRISAGFQNPVSMFVGHLVRACVYTLAGGFFRLFLAFQTGVFSLFWGIFWEVVTKASRRALSAIVWDCGHKINVLNVIRKFSAAIIYCTTSERGRVTQS